VNAKLRLARFLALAAPVLLLGGAFMSEYVFGLYPCEMCWWQRYAHLAALPFAVLAFVLPQQRWPLALAGLAILVSGLIGGYHAGVEYGWFEGFTACTSTAAGGDPLLDAPIVRCDVAPCTLANVSLAGFNFLLSGAAAAAIFGLLTHSRKGALG
jgi:disulfide bond formation protein DsbB